jgi:hypothetical protein
MRRGMWQGVPHPFELASSLVGPVVRQAWRLSLRSSKVRRDPCSNRYAGAAGVTLPADGIGDDADRAGDRGPFRAVPIGTEGTYRPIRKMLRSAPDVMRVVSVYPRSVPVERVSSLQQTRDPRCGRYVRRYGKDGGPCNHAAIAIVDGGLVCYVHAPAALRPKPSGR